MKTTLLAAVCCSVTAGLIAVNAASLLHLVSANYAALSNGSTYRNHWHAVTTSYTSNPDPSASPSSSNSSDSSGTTTPQQPASSATMNWSGYASSAHGTYTAVTGSWKVPDVSSSTNDLEADATWIGIGGDTSDDLIQVGTQNVVASGQVSSGSFYERLPNTANDIPTMNVNPGDNISASIKQTSPGIWAVNIKDTTNGEAYSNSVPYNSSESSAEWIEEAPSSGNTILPLDNFGSVTFANATTTLNGKSTAIGGSSPQALTMDNYAGQALTDSSPITSTGNSFTIDQTAASNNSTSSPQQQTQYPGWSQSGSGGWSVWNGSGWGGDTDPTTQGQGDDSGHHGYGWQSQNGGFSIYFND